MRGAWWGREAPAGLRSGHDNPVPELLAGDRARLLQLFDGRRPSFTPEWAAQNADDAGTALRQLFGEQLEAVAQRLNRWPMKALVAFLDGAGIEALPGSAAEALLTIEVPDTAPGSVLVAAGFQAGARVDGVDSLVAFETERTLYAAPGKLGEVFVADRGSFVAVDPAQPFAPFGDPASQSATLLIGFATAAAASVALTFGVGVAAPSGAPPPASAGGVAPLPVPPGPTLAWEALDGGRWVPLDITRDETGGLAQGGLVELALPAQWRPGTPSGLAGAKSIRWLRVRIAQGVFAVAPRLLWLAINMVRALGASTVLDEIPSPVPGSNGRRMLLSQVPVLPGSLDLDVDDSGLGPTGQVRWTAVSDLAQAGSEDEVYEIDYTSGIITFGDGQHGRALPEGFRIVHATKYRAQSTVPDRVEAGAISVAITPLANVSKVANPLPASGGGATETMAQVLQRGPLEIRTRSRAVTPADYALLALRATGAQIARALAVPGLHPRYPGASIPGVVCVLAVPPDRGDGAPPVPDEQTLRALATSLSTAAAPAGVEVVAAAPEFQTVRIEVGILMEEAADAGTAATSVLRALDRYLHPLTGGDDGAGWPFGGAIQYVRLLLLVTAVAGVRATSWLSVVLDGVRQPTCQDVAIRPNALLWPEGHEVAIADPGAVP